MFKKIAKPKYLKDSKRGKLTIRQFNILRNIAIETGLEITIPGFESSDIIHESKTVNGMRITMFDDLVGLIFNQSHCTSINCSGKYLTQQGFGHSNCNCCCKH